MLIKISNNSLIINKESLNEFEVVYVYRYLIENVKYYLIDTEKKYYVSASKEKLFDVIYDLSRQCDIEIM